MSQWMNTITGREHFLSGYEVMRNEIDVYDVAHSLSQINRFTGHATRPYSVAEHSLLCADLARRDGKSATVQLACLLHDAHEAYTGDLGTPAKHAVGLAWPSFEMRQADCVRRAFQITATFAAHKQLIYRYDQVALATERRALTAFDITRHRLWSIDTPGQEVAPADVNLNTLDRVERTWSEWKNLFLERFFDLQREIQAAHDALAASPLTPNPKEA